MRIAFITHSYPNYVPDLLLHGLRKLMGPDVGDFPRKDCLYRGVLGLGACPENQLCPSWFPADDGRIDRRYPDALLQATPVPSREEPIPRGRVGRDEYYRSLQQCRIVLSLEGAGCDTFRFWENAACNGVHLAARLPLFVPNDFIDGRHILRFDDLDELRCRIDRVLENRAGASEMIIAGRYHLIQHHLTTERARYFLDRVVRSFEN